MKTLIIVVLSILLINAVLLCLLLRKGMWAMVVENEALIKQNQMLSAKNARLIAEKRSDNVEN